MKIKQFNLLRVKFYFYHYLYNFLMWLCKKIPGLHGATFYFFFKNKLHDHYHRMMHEFSDANDILI
jgi:hypothetical protein